MMKIRDRKRPSSVAVLIALLGLWPVELRAQGEPSGLELLQSARQKTDLWASANGFRLTTKLRYKDFQGGLSDGSFVHEWASADRWRWRADGPGLSDTIILQDQARWVHFSDLKWPLGLVHLEQALQLLRPARQSPSRLRAQRDRDRSLRCFRDESYYSSRDVYCFDSQTGFLKRVVRGHGTYEFGDYLIRGENAFPQTLRVLDGKDVIVDASLALEDYTDLGAAFPVPPGSQRWAIACLPDPPQARMRHDLPPILSTIKPEPIEHRLTSRDQGTIMITAVIRKDATVGDAVVIRSVSRAMDAALLGSMRRWRFPSTVFCGEEPREIPILVISSVGAMR